MVAPDARRFRSTASRNPRRWHWRRLWLVPAALWLALAIWHTHKPLPEGAHVQGAATPVSAGTLRFLTDVTHADASGTRRMRHTIHAAVLDLVRDAQDFLLLDYFLFNGQGGPRGPLQLRDGLEPVSRELIDALREVRRARPDMPVLVITDPLNDYYRGTAPPALATLEEAGIDVVVTPLGGLRDSNPLYSATWRLLFKWWLPVSGEGRWPNVLDGAGPGLKLGALLRLPNFKANHRKVVITGDGQGSMLGIVTSANPHDASSAHSNVALRLGGDALRPLLESELAIAHAAGWRGDAAVWHPAPATQPTEAEVTAATLTEGAIRDALLERFAAATQGDDIDVAQFYLSDRDVIGALVEAAKRGVHVRVLLDANRDAFGFEKSGVPNRPVAQELIERSDGGIALRWYRTQGEQFHSKLAAVRSGERLWMTLGSANFTRRNLDDLNLEANIAVELPAGHPVAVEIGEWFEALWHNAGGIPYSDAADKWTDDGFLRYWQYRVMEASGLSTF